MDTTIQRKNMVESQVRPSDVTDRRIIRAMLDVPRELFVAEGARALAYMDGPVQLARDGAAVRTLLPPRTFAKLLQAAQIEPTAAVLDVGAATGYAAAVLARFAGSVVALDCDEAMLARARETLPAVGAEKVLVVAGPLAEGWPNEGPYDAIVVEGAVETMPPELLDQLKDGGRLVAILRRGQAGRATVWRREGGTVGAIDVFDASGDILPGFARPPAFAF